MTIYKYRCRVRDGAFCIELPETAQVLSVQLQGGVPHLWVILSPREPNVNRWFRWYGTGERIEVREGPAYVGTVQIDSFVWHLFEVKPVTDWRESPEVKAIT